MNQLAFLIAQLFFWSLVVSKYWSYRIGNIGCNEPKLLKKVGLIFVLFVSCNFLPIVFLIAIAIIPIEILRKRWIEKDKLSSADKVPSAS